MSFGEYIVSGRDKLGDAMLPFRLKNLQKELADLDALVARINHLGDSPPARQAASVETEHDRIVRAATGGATMGGPFSGGGAPEHVEFSGQARVDVSVHVSPTSDLLKAVADAKSTTMQLKAGGALVGLRAAARASTGTSMPEATPQGRTGTGKQ